MSILLHQPPFTSTFCLPSLLNLPKIFSWTFPLAFVLNIIDSTIYCFLFHLESLYVFLINMYLQALCKDLISSCVLFSSCHLAQNSNMPSHEVFLRFHLLRDSSYSFNKFQVFDPYTTGLSILQFAFNFRFSLNLAI